MPAPISVSGAVTLILNFIDSGALGLLVGRCTTRLSTLLALFETFPSLRILGLALLLVKRV